MATSAHDFSFNRIDGELLELSSFAGQALLIVNTASECDYTPQYAELQTLWTRYRAKGLVVLGVPSNDFGAQEPGSETEIKQFCRTNYAVDFPLTQKQRVAGGDAHPFYQWVVEEIGEVAAPKWNFHKYLIGPDGSLAGLWPPDTSPLDPELAETINDLLTT